MAYLVVYENADERQVLIVKGHGTEAIVRKLRKLALALPDRCDGWTVGDPREGESHASMTYIEGYEHDPDFQWEFFDTDVHRPGEAEVDNFETTLMRFIERAISNVTFAPTPIGAKRLAKGQVI